jgi:hypothetical protein
LPNRFIEEEGRREKRREKEEGERGERKRREEEEEGNAPHVRRGGRQGHRSRRFL